MKEIKSSEIKINHRGFIFTLEQVMDIIEENNEFVTKCDLEKLDEEITNTIGEKCTDLANEISEIKDALEALKNDGK